MQSQSKYYQDFSWWRSIDSKIQTEVQRTESSQTKRKKTNTTTLEKKNTIGTRTSGDVTVITKLQ